MSHLWIPLRSDIAIIENGQQTFNWNPSDTGNPRKNASRKRSTSDVKIRKDAFLRNSLDSRWGELAEQDKLTAIFDLAKLGLSLGGQKHATKHVDEIAELVKRVFEEKDKQMKSLDETRRDEMTRYQTLFNDNQKKMHALEQQAIEEIQSIHIQLNKERAHSQSLLEENSIFVNLFRRQQLDLEGQMGQTRKRQANGEQAHVHKTKSVRLLDEMCVSHVLRPKCLSVRAMRPDAHDVVNPLEPDDFDISDLEWDYDAVELQDDSDSFQSLESEGSDRTTPSSDGSATDNIDVRDGYERKKQVQQFKDQGIVNPRK